MQWIKSDQCEGGACVEVTFTGSDTPMVAVRNSQVPGELVWFTAEEWDTFVASVRAGGFDTTR